MRRRIGLSQSIAAERLGITTPHLSRVECGHITPSVRLMTAMASLYGQPLRGVLMAFDRVRSQAQEVA